MAASQLLKSFPTGHSILNAPCSLGFNHLPLWPHLLHYSISSLLQTHTKQLLQLVTLLKYSCVLSSLSVCELRRCLLLVSFPDTPGQRWVSPLTVMCVPYHTHCNDLFTWQPSALECKIFMRMSLSWASIPQYFQAEYLEMVGCVFWLSDCMNEHTIIEWMNPPEQMPQLPKYY